MKRVTIILTIMTLLICCSLVSAAEVNKEGNNTLSLNQALQEIMKAQGVHDIKSIDCSKVTEKQMEDLGDAFMDVMHPDSSEHEFMDRMMGGEKSPTLVSMKRLMGARYLGCYKGEVPFGGMMDPLYGGRGYGDDYYDRRWPHMPMENDGTLWWNIHVDSILYDTAYRVLPRNKMGKTNRGWKNSPRYSQEKICQGRYHKRGV